MSGTRVEISGDDRLNRTLDQAGDRLTDLRDPNRAAGDTIAARAAQLAPRVSGILAASIRADATPTEAVIFATAPYAGPIHGGWPARNITAQPFLTDAATDTEPAFLEAYGRHVATTLDHVKGA
jgi:hypothetical protein